jgi:hypothetical protein
MLESVAEPLYGDFNGIASRYDEHEAWVPHTDRWVEINRISHRNAVRRISKALFDQFFPDIPSLPLTAFRRGETVTMRGASQGARWLRQGGQGKGAEAAQRERLWVIPAVTARAKRPN